MYPPAHFQHHSGHQAGWHAPPPAQQQHQYTAAPVQAWPGQHAGMPPQPSSSYRSDHTSAPWQPPSQQHPGHSTSAAAAAAAGGGFNYGFGQVQQPRPMPSYSHASSSAQGMGHMGSFSTQQQHSAPHSEQAFMDAERDTLKSVKDLPTAFQPIFNFRFFNPVQSECFVVASTTDTNMVVSAPTGAGKTGVMELAMLRLLSKHLVAAAAQQQHFQPPRGGNKIIYLGPIKALVQERQVDWQARFGQVLGLKVVQLTGDDDTDGLEDMETADIICSTPEKFDQVTRKVAEKGSMGLFGEIGLVLLDEVHLLNEAGRGSSLEAGCVCRIKAVAAFAEMARTPLAAVRFVAVSATIPNIADIARWLSVPPSGLRQYGDELRPCKLTTHVKGYAPSKNDFLFERRLNDHVSTIIRDYSKGRPALVFCSSRKGTTEAAAAIVKEAEAHAQVAAFSGPAGGSTGSTFVRDMAQLQRLRAAAASTQAKALASVLVAGVGFHNAAMEPADRALVEELFKASDLAVLCTTSTLAMGVNLPAHLVVLKGTVRWVGDSEVVPGEQAGYKEYSQTEVLQMVGRAGRPQFDTEGVAVIMTSRDSTHRYQRLLAGQVVESCLLSTLPEHLCAEVVLGTVKDVSQAIAWIRSTFLFTRVRANPQHYGLKLKPGATEAELDALLRDQIVLQPVQELMKYQLIESDDDNYSLTATPAGKLMAANFLKLKTMAAIIQLGERPSVPSLLRVICGAEEFKNTGLRRSEKKVLNEINHSKDPEQLRYHVMGSKDGKVKERVSLPAEKLFILLNDALADKPSEALDYSLKQEQTRLMVVGQRIAKCMAKYYVVRGSFCSAGRSLLLTRSLKNRLWEDSQCSVRQLPSVGRQLGARLAAAGLGSLQAVAACGDPHRLEVAAQKPYPWGSELLAALRAHTPPAVDISLQLLGLLPGSQGYSCQVTLAKCAATAGPAAAAGSSAAAMQFGGPPAASAWAAAAGADSSPSGFTSCKLLVGCNTDELLLLRSVVLEKLDEPMQVKFKVAVPAGITQPISVTATLLHDKLIGFDQKASMALPAVGRQQRLGPASYSDSRQAPDNSSEAADGGAAAAGGGRLAGPEAAQDRSRQQDSDTEQADLGAAAAAHALLQHKQRLRSKRAREAAATAASDASGGPIPSSDSQGYAPHAARDVPGVLTADPSLSDMPPPAKRPRGVHQPADPPLPGPPGLQQQTTQGHGQQHMGAHPSSTDKGHSSVDGASSWQPPPMQSSIAARYKSLFSLGAGGLGGLTARAGNAADAAADSSGSAAGSMHKGAGAAADAHAAAGSGAAGSAAMDAGELQVTPAGPDKTPRSAALPAAHSAAVEELLGSAASTGGKQVQRPMELDSTAAAAAAGSPVRDAGQVMSALFDMLADEEDAQPEEQLQQPPQRQQQLLLPPKPREYSMWQLHSTVQPAHGQLPESGAGAEDTEPVQQHGSRTTPAAAAAAAHQQEQHRQRQPLAEVQFSMQRGLSGNGPAAGSRPFASDRATASAAFGAAVLKSNRATTSLLSGLHCGSDPAGLQAGQPVGARALPSTQFSTGAGSRPARLHEQQQLLTPPRQIVPSFAEPAAAGAGSNNSSHSSPAVRSVQQGRQRGLLSQTQKTQELPADFRRFAFSAGSGAAQDTQPYRPSANAALFGHLSATQNSQVQHKLLNRASPGRSTTAQGSGPGWRRELLSSAPAGYAGMSQGCDAASGLGGTQPGGLTSSSSRPQVPLPGSLPWRQFVSGQHQAATGPDEGAAGGSLAGAVTATPAPPKALKQVRAAWQGPAAGQTMSAASSFVFGAAGSSLQPAAAPLARWGAAAPTAGMVEEPSSLAPAVAAAVPDPGPVPATDAAADDDGLDLGQIFAFMR